MNYSRRRLMLFEVHRIHLRVHRIYQVARRKATGDWHWSARFASEEAAQPEVHAQLVVGAATTDVAVPLGYPVRS